MKNYVVAPNIVKYSELRTKGSLSPSCYSTVRFANSHWKSLRSILGASPYKDGEEVGSAAYVDSSGRHFLRTSAIQPYNYVIRIDSESVLHIKPANYERVIAANADRTLTDGDIIYAKAGNVGDVAFCYGIENATFSSHILKLNIPQNKYYVFAFLKSEFCRAQQQLGIVGSIKGLDMFDFKVIDECKIPFPSGTNAATVIGFVEVLVKCILEKELEIRRKNQMINQLIESELESQNTASPFQYKYPTYSELARVGRLDTGVYTLDYKRQMHKVTNYANGCQTLSKMGFSIRRGQNLQFSEIGHTIITEQAHPKYYTLIYPTYVSDYRIIDKLLYLGSKLELQRLVRGDSIRGRGCG